MACADENRSSDRVIDADGLATANPHRFTYSNRHAHELTDRLAYTHAYADVEMDPADGYADAY